MVVLEEPIIILTGFSTGQPLVLAGCVPRSDQDRDKSFLALCTASVVSLSRHGKRIRGFAADSGGEYQACTGC